MKLISEQVESFHRDGCLVVDGYFDDHEIDHIRACKNRTGQPRRGLAMHFMDAKMPDPDMLKILPEGATPMLRGSAAQARTPAG